MSDAYVFSESGFLGGSFPWAWAFLLSGGGFLFLLLVWFSAGALLAFREDSVDRPSRIAQLYGYTVCLVGLLVALYSITSLISTFFERANPLQSDYPFGASLTSFESYQATWRTAEPRFSGSERTPPDTASEGTLRERYNALVADRRASVQYRTSKALWTSSLLLLLAVALFGFHWRWVRRFNGVAPAT